MDIQMHVSPEIKGKLAMMVSAQIEAQGIKDTKVLQAMREVPREKFVPECLQMVAYADGPLPIGEGQTISQPFIVAYMTEELKLSPKDHVLEIGTGSGYQTAILAELSAKVYSIEIIKSLGEKAKTLLIDELGYKNISLKIDDGYEGWQEFAPFDAIILTAAPPRNIPEPLIEQLKVGGRLIAPVGLGGFFQYLVLIIKRNKGIEQHTLLPVSFVTMTGKTQHK